MAKPIKTLKEAIVSKISNGGSDVTVDDNLDLQSSNEIKNATAVSTDSVSVGGQDSINYYPPVRLDEASNRFLDNTSPPGSYMSIGVDPAPSDATHAIVAMVSIGDGASDIHEAKLREAGTTRNYDAIARGWAGHGSDDAANVGIVPLDTNNNIEYKTNNSTRVILGLAGYF